MRAVDRPRLYRRIPPWVQQKHVFGGRQVESHASGFQAHEKERAFGIVLKAFDNRLAIDRLPIQVRIGQLLAIEMLANDVEEAGELREDERLVTFGRDLGQ